jgi:DNA/RNA endonuclease YhcR with UshA esterase domain
MKRFTSTLSFALVFGLLASVPLGLAADTAVTTTEKTTTYTGVVSEINPGTSTIILKSETAPAPVTYTFTKETVFVDAQGKVVSSETIRNVPVTVEYLKEGDRTIVRRVVMTRPGSVIRKEETTTHTETR